MSGGGPRAAIPRAGARGAVFTFAVDRRIALATLAAVGITWALFAELISLDAYRRLDPATVLGQAVHDAIPSIIYLGAGVVARAVRPTSRTGSWLYLAGFLSFVGNLANTQVPGLQQLGAGFTDLYQVAIGIVVLTYPTGRFVKPAHRALALIATGWLVVFGLLVTAYLDPALCTSAFPCPANPFLVIRDRELAHTIFEANQVIGAALWLAFIACVVERWIHGTRISRRLLLPVWIAGILVAGGNLISTALFALDAGATSQAWDYWINNLVISSSLPLVFLGGLLGSRLARASIADFVEETSAGVSLGTLRDSFARLVGDPELVLAFPVGPGEFADADGRPVALPARGGDRIVTPIERGGGTVAVVVHDAALETDPAIVRAAGAAAGLALENERLTAEVRTRLETVRSSRARLVEAADAERARIERMLHDGAQQRLVALAIQLRALAAGAEDGGVRERLEALGGELDDALGELRELARGIHPSVLVQAGLRSALESLAQRSPVPVALDVPDDRFPDAIEATAYYVAAEAITNAVRHAHASAIAMTVRATDRLELTVTDDGVGGADPGAGSGLAGLDDRVAALGGSMEISSAPGHGTMVRVSLPLVPPANGRSG